MLGTECNSGSSLEQKRAEKWEHHCWGEIWISDGPAEGFVCLEMRDQNIELLLLKTDWAKSEQILLW